MARIKKLHSFFTRRGIRQVRQEGSHRKYHHPDCHNLTVSVHPSREIDPKTLAKILKDAGTTLDEFKSG